MEEDDKNAVAAKMISTSTIDPQKEEPSQTETETSSQNRKEVGADVAMDDSSTFPLPLVSSFNITPKKRKEVGEDVAMTDSSTFPLPLDSSPKITPKKRKGVSGDVAMNNPSTFPLESSPKITPKKRKEVSGDVAMNNPSTFPSPMPLPLDSSPSLTPKKRKEGPETETSSAETSTKIKRGRGRPRSYGSLTTSSQTDGPSQTTSADTPTKKRPGRPPKLTPCLRYLNAGQDVVDLIYNVSEAFPHRTFSIMSVNGPISKVSVLNPNGVLHHKGKFEIISISLTSLVGDDGCNCRAKAKCSVSWIDGEGTMYASTSVNSVIAAGPTKVITAYFDTYTANKAGARILASAADARNDDSDSRVLVSRSPLLEMPNAKLFATEAPPLKMITAISDPSKEYCAKVMEETASRMLVEGQTCGLPPITRFLPPTPSLADADIINDQDMKSPSAGDT